MGSILSGIRSLLTTKFTIEERTSRRSILAAMDEFDRVLERVVGFRDTAKYLSTKLIHLLVTDDIDALERSRPLTGELLEHFNAADLSRDGSISAEEWEVPVPLVLPNGRPPGIFERLDRDGDRYITHEEYREPDLLLDCIAAWQESRGSVREVLRVILFSNEFLSLKFYRAKVKTPFEVMASTMRALDGEISNGDVIALTHGLARAGMEFFDFADPTGESELATDWVHTVGLLERLRFLILAGGNRPEDRPFRWDSTRLGVRWGLQSAEDAVDYLALLFYGGELLAPHRRLAEEAYRRADGGGSFEATAAFLLSLPAFQTQ